MNSGKNKDEEIALFFFFFDAFLKTCHNRVTFLFIRQLLPD